MTAGTLSIDRVPVTASGVKVYVYNLAGELVRTLAEGRGMDLLPSASARRVNSATGESGLSLSSPQPGFRRTIPEPEKVLGPLSREACQPKSKSVAHQ